MVCVSTSFLLVEFIIAVGRSKVNRLRPSFTICLQNGQIRQNLFINRSKSFRRIELTRASHCASIWHANI